MLASSFLHAGRRGHQFQRSRTASPSRQFPVIAELAADLLRPPRQQWPGIADNQHQRAPRTAAVTLKASPRRTSRSGAIRLASPAMNLPSITVDTDRQAAGRCAKNVTSVLGCSDGAVAAVLSMIVSSEILMAVCRAHQRAGTRPTPMRAGPARHQGRVRQGPRVSWPLGAFGLPDTPEGPPSAVAPGAG